MNVTKADVYWVTCQLCDFTTDQTTDYDKAERLRQDHRRTHGGDCQAVNGLGFRCSLIAGHTGRDHEVTLTWKSAADLVSQYDGPRL